MPSSLNGLFRTLAWADFPRRQARAPGPGQSATAAQTFSSFSSSAISFSSHAGRFLLVDNVVASVTFGRSQSFVSSWLFSRPQSFRDDMLHHEQGHYNITALVGRDFFIDLMLLKAQTFSTAQAGLEAVQMIRQGSLNKLGAIQQLYDVEVHPEQQSGNSRGPVQQSWDRYCQTAFTQARASGTLAANGVPHKVRLVDVLIQNRKQI